MHCRACERLEKLLHFHLMCILGQWIDSLCIICVLQVDIVLIAQTVAENMTDSPAGLWAVGEISTGLRNPQASYELTQWLSR